MACGYSQVGGVDFTEVFSPVVNDTSFRLWLLWSMMYRKKRVIFDIDVAFLNGDLEEEIFMDCPKGLEHEEDECLLLATADDIWTGSKRANVQFEVPRYPIQIGLQAVCVRTLLILQRKRTGSDYVGFLCG